MWWELPNAMNRKQCLLRVLFYTEWGNTAWLNDVFKVINYKTVHGFFKYTHTERKKEPSVLIFSYPACFFLQPNQSLNLILVMLT